MPILLPWLCEASGGLCKSTATVKLYCARASRSLRAARQSCCNPFHCAHRPNNRATALRSTTRSGFKTSSQNFAHFRACGSMAPPCKYLPELARWLSGTLFAVRLRHEATATPLAQGVNKAIRPWIDNTRHPSRFRGVRYFLSELRFISL